MDFMRIISNSSTPDPHVPESATGTSPSAEQRDSLMGTAEFDLIDDLLLSFGFRAHVYASPRLCGAWQINPGDAHQASFHLVARGACWLQRPQQAPLALASGDLVVFPRTGWHVLGGQPGLLGQGETVFPSWTIEQPQTHLVCGAFEFLHGHDNPLIESLPDCIVVRAEGESARLAAIARLLSEEAIDSGPGRQAILDKLSETLFVMLTRRQLRDQAPDIGWLAAVADPAIGPVLKAIHREPGRPWQIIDLANRSGLSRTIFMARFSRLLGQTPIAYLTEWRMRCAERLLREGKLSVEEISGRLGYETPAAFRRAFKRVTGVPPGALRRPAEPERRST